MKLDNAQLINFINRIKLAPKNMPKYRNQINHLREKLEKKMKEDTRTGTKVIKILIAGSWKKRTINRRMNEEWPIDIDLVFFIQTGDKSLKEDMEKLHDFIVEYLEETYPNKDINRDVDAEGKTKSIKIKFASSGLEVDIVPVVPLDKPKTYVWQPQRRGGGRYTTSVEGQLNFATDRKKDNSSYTSIVRALKWWRSYKELDQLSSFAIELIVAHLDIKYGAEENIEEGIIRFFEKISSGNIKIIEFDTAINSVPYHFPSSIYISDPTNNENNVAKKLKSTEWNEVMTEANDAFETLSIAQSREFQNATNGEWKSIFGPSFSIKPLD